MNKHIIPIILILIYTSSLIAQDWGVIRYAQTTVNIREKRSTKSSIVSQLQSGEKVKADFLKENWYAIFSVDARNRDERKAIGFVYAPLLGPEKPTGKDITSKPPLKYQIVKKEDVSYRGSARMVYRIVLDVRQIPSKLAMKEVAKSIWKKGNTQWDEFTVFIYLPGMRTNSSAYGVGEFRPDRMLEFRTQDFALYGTKWKQ